MGSARRGRKDILGWRRRLVFEHKLKIEKFRWKVTCFPRVRKNSTWHDVLHVHRFLLLFVAPDAHGREDEHDGGEQSETDRDPSQKVAKRPEICCFFVNYLTFNALYSGDKFPNEQQIWDLQSKLKSVFSVRMSGHDLTKSSTWLSSVIL